MWGAWNDTVQNFERNRKNAAVLISVFLFVVLWKMPEDD